MMPRTGTRGAAARRTDGHAGKHRSRVRKRGANSAWYATDLAFCRTLEADVEAHPEHRRRLACRLTDPAALRTRQRVLVYTHEGLAVPGRRDRIPVRIEFHENPNYPTYGHAPAEYPRVVADPGAESKHRMSDDSLCLWFPGDPAERCWHHADGLVMLLNTIRNHLFFEEHWRATGGDGSSGSDEGVWLGDEAPHGFTAEGGAA